MDILHNYEYFVYIIIFLAVFLEDAAFIGILIPGELAVVLSGILALQGYLQPEICFWTIAIGAILGDSIGYIVGKRTGRDYFINHERLLLLREKHFQKTGELLQEQGGVAIFLSRFVVGLRAIIPVTAGMYGMPYRQFLINNVSGAMAWTVVFTMLGYLLEFCRRLIEMWSGRAGFLALIIIMIPAGFIYIYWTAVRRPGDAVIGAKCPVVVPSTFVVGFNKRHPGIAAFVGKRMAAENFLGISLTMRLVICIILLWIFGELTLDIVISNALVTLDQRVLGIVRNLQTPDRTRLMTFFSAAGGEIVQTAGSIALIIYFSYKRQFTYLITYLSAMIGGSLLVYGMKAATHRIRPIMPVPDVSMGWSFPSGHSMMSLIFYGMITYLVINNICSGRIRTLMAVMGALTIFMIGASRIYLQVHFLSDVLAGYTAGLLWLTACVTALEIYVEKTGKTDKKRLRCLRT